MRSANRKRLEYFYSCLGVRFLEHQHGGPIHAECGDVDKDFVVEIYSAAAGYQHDALMLQTDALEECLAAALGAGAKIVHPITERAGIRFAYISDPDERHVMVFQVAKQ